jgi:hypothetical protein
MISANAYKRQLTLGLGFSAVQTKIKLEHVISFSDAIFAFSITFMAISKILPKHKLFRA